MRIPFIWGCVQTAAAANWSSIKKEKKKTLLTDHICQSRDSTGGNGNSLDGCCDDNNNKVFQMTLKVEVMLIHFSDVRNWHPRKSLPKSAKPAIPLRRKPQKRECLRQMTPTYLGHTTNSRVFLLSICAKAIILYASSSLYPFPRFCGQPNSTFCQGNALHVCYMSVYSTWIS